jgi:predicted deacylase
MGVGMRITNAYCEQLLDGIMNLLSQLGMWSGDVRAVKTPLVSKDRSVGFVNSDAAGIFIPRVTHNSFVQAGDIVGSVLDPLTGAVVENAVAPCDGLLFTLREYPVVFGGSLLARIMGDDGND